MKVKIRKGDQVQVISGRFEDKGKRGEVIKVMPDEGRLVVQGVNLQTKHQSQVHSKGRNISPGKIRLEGSVHISNVALVCPKCRKPVKVGILRNGKLVQRVCKKCEALIDE